MADEPKWKIGVYGDSYYGKMRPDGCWEYGRRLPDGTIIEQHILLPDGRGGSDSGMLLWPEQWPGETEERRCLAARECGNSAADGRSLVGTSPTITAGMT